jgi:serine protease Do
MNTRTVLMCLGLGALGVMLTALPGSSTGIQDSENHSVNKEQGKPGVSEDRTQRLADKLAIQQSVSTNLQEVEKLQTPEAEDIEVFLGDGGSWLGVETKEVSAETVQKLKLPAERGALVGKIVSDSPAAKAGLKENDVITEINGQRVEGTAQFRRLIREVPAGRTVQLTLVRDGRAQQLSVALGKSEPGRWSSGMLAPTAGAFKVVTELPEIMELGDVDTLVAPNFGQPRVRPRLGIDAEDLQGELGSYFGAPDGEGVLVRSVLADSPAAKGGLKSGDVITIVNGQRIRNIHQLREQLHGAKDDQPLKMGLLRNKTEISLSVVLPAPAVRETHQRGERSTM